MPLENQLNSWLHKNKNTCRYRVCYAQGCFLFFTDIGELQNLSGDFWEESDWNFYATQPLRYCEGLQIKLLQDTDFLIVAVKNQNFQVNLRPDITFKDILKKDHPLFFYQGQGIYVGECLESILSLPEISIYINMWDLKAINN
jgi:hypothetical protein